MLDDITNQEDVDRLVRLFYDKATVDPTIGHFFTTVIQLNWSTHIPRIVDFWTSILFGAPGYSGNPMDAHIKLNMLSPLKKEHFDKWVELWTQTVRENFEGPKADEAVVRGGSIAQIMAMKLHP